MNHAGTILVADDDWTNRELLQAHLENAGYRVLEANGGRRALELAGQESPDIVLLDVRMPDMSGYETCVTLKTTESTRHIPVLLMTALETDESRLKTVEAGADDVLPKPFDVPVMLMRIGTLMKLKRLREELGRREQALHEILARRLPPDVAHEIMDIYRRAAEGSETDV